MGLPPGYPLNGPPVFDMGIMLSGTGQTTTTQTADICNNVFKGITVVLNVTSLTGTNVVVNVQGKDTGSGAYFNLLTGTAITGVTATPVPYTIYPGIGPTGANVVSGILPAFFRIQIVPTAATFTYTISASLTT